MAPFTVEVVAHDPAWAGLAATAIAELRAALPGVLAEIEHIGSTAVPGLAAKPIIDLMAAADLAAVPPHDAALAALGYHPRDNNMPNRVFYARAAAGRTTHHLHIVTLDSWPTRNQRLLRDHLRAHPEDAARYAALKATILAGDHSPDGYTRAKTDLIQELTDRARAERGLPSVSVWES